MGQTLGFFKTSDSEKCEIWRLIKPENWNEKSKEQLLALYNQYGEHFHLPTSLYVTTLGAAIYARNKEAAEFLIDYCGADVDGSKAGYPPIVIACQHGCFEMIRMLLEQYAHLHNDLLSSVEYGLIELDLPRGTSENWQYPEIRRYLVSMQSNILNSRISSEESAKKKDGILLEQLRRGVYAFQEGETLDSVFSGLFRRYRMRLYTDFKFYGEKSPIMYAAIFGQTEVIRAFIDECFGRVEEEDVRIRWVLHEAFWSQQLEVIKMLVEEYKCNATSITKYVPHSLPKNDPVVEYLMAAARKETSENGQPSRQIKEEFIDTIAEHSATSVRHLSKESMMQHVLPPHSHAPAGASS